MGKTTYKYNAAGNLVESTQYGSDGKTEGWLTFKVGPKGLVMESDGFDSKGECSSIGKSYYEFYP